MAHARTVKVDGICVLTVLKLPMLTGEARLLEARALRLTIEKLGQPPKMVMPEHRCRVCHREISLSDRQCFGCGAPTRGNPQDEVRDK